MDLENRIRLIEQLADGELPLRDLAGLNRRDLASIAHLGAVALEAKKFEQAAQIFAGLEALEPGNPCHPLHRAQAEAKGGQTEAAIASLTRYLEREDARPADDLARALLLRATLNAPRNPEDASLDVAAAKMLAEGSPLAKAVVEGVAR